MQFSSEVKVATQHLHYKVNIYTNCIGCVLFWGFLNFTGIFLGGKRGVLMGKLTFYHDRCIPDVRSWNVTRRFGGRGEDQKTEGALVEKTMWQSTRDLGG